MTILEPLQKLLSQGEPARKLSLKKEDFFNLSVDFGKVFSVDSALILSEKLKSVALCLKELNDYLKNVDILEFYDPNDL